MLLASDMLCTSGWQEVHILCAGSGSVPGGVGSLQVSFDAGELWAHRTLCAISCSLLYPEELH